MFSQSSRCLRQTLPLGRTSALSRFPRRNTGASRALRRPIQNVSEPTTPEFRPRENTCSSGEPGPWKTSQRPPATTNPSDSLKRLLLENDRLIVERQIEMLNIFIGFEQSNTYSISNELGEPLGYIAEEPRGFLAVMARQAFATHRPFRAVIMDLQGSPIMWVRRPFAWINSRMFVQRLKDLSEYTPDGKPVLDTFAEVQQVWHPWRRRYDLFIRESPERILSTASEAQPEPEPSVFTQFAKVDSGFLAWHFKLVDRRGEEISYISRAFRGFGREIFTDTGRYSVNFGPRESEIEKPGTQHVLRDLTLDERAVTLALAVNIDFDYFSRHSGSGPGHGGLFGMTAWE